MIINDRFDVGNLETTEEIKAAVAERLAAWGLTQREIDAATITVNTDRDAAFGDRYVDVEAETR